MTERPSALPRYTQPLFADDPVSVGPYLLLARIAGGATGTVYLSRDSSGAWVAVRALHSGHAGRTDVRARFAAAVDRARHIDGRWTCAVVDAATDAEIPYVVFEFVDGPTLAQEIDARGPLSPGELRRVAVDMAAAIQSLHRVQVVHGGLEPTDVVLSVTGARLVDLGTSRALAALLMPETLIPAGADQDVATAPEVLAGNDAIPATDVLGWANLVVHAATGRVHADLPSSPADRPRRSREPNENPPERSGDPRGPQLPPAQGRTGDGSSRSPSGRRPGLSDLAGLDDTLGPLVAQALADDPDARPTTAEIVSRLAGPRRRVRRGRDASAADAVVVVPAARPGATPMPSPRLSSPQQPPSPQPAPRQQPPSQQPASQRSPLSPAVPADTPPRLETDDPRLSRRARRALVAGAVFLTVAASAAAVAPAVSASGDGSARSAAESDSEPSLDVAGVPAPILATSLSPEPEPTTEPTPGGSEPPAASAIPLTTLSQSGADEARAAPHEGVVPVDPAPVGPMTPAAVPPAAPGPAQPQPEPVPAAPLAAEPSAPPSPSGLAPTQILVAPLTRAPQ